MAALEEKKKKLEAKRNSFNAKIKKLASKIKQKERKQDARKKIIAGAILLKYFENTNQKSLLDQILGEGLDNDQDRKLFGLKTQTQPSVSEEKKNEDLH